MQQNLSYKNTYIIDTTTHTGSTLAASELYDYYKLSGGTTITGLTGGTLGQQICVELLTDTTFTNSATLILPGAEDLEGTDGGIYRFARTSSTAWTCIGNSILGGGGSISGDVTIDTLTLTDGHLIFPATQDESSNVNTLDDYEEGTYVPTVTGSTSGSYTVNESYPFSYTKIGNLVSLYGIIYITAVGDGTSGLLLITLPFTSGTRDLIGSASLYNKSEYTLGCMRIFTGSELTVFGLISFLYTDATIVLTDAYVDAVWQLSVDFSYKI